MVRKDVIRAQDTADIAWQMSVILGVYRLFLIAILLLVYLAFFFNGKTYFFSWSFLLFLVVIYAFVASLLLYLLVLKKCQFVHVTMIGACTDIIMLTFLMANNQELLIAYGLLMNLSIAAASIILASRLSLFLAALAAISVMLSQIYVSLSSVITLDLIQRTGFLCVTFFVIAFLTLTLSKRIRQSEAIARKQGENIETLEQINATIVQSMPQGVLVIDEHDRIIISNKAAWYLLGAVQRVGHPLLSEISSLLMEHLTKWREQPNDLQLNKALLDLGINPNFTAMVSPKGQRKATLILLEDTVLLSKEAQQIKLASLGRLTASIAHEIRNPLSSISHAVQLLLESPVTDNTQQRMFEIIKKNSGRVNQIIESILQLSRRKESVPTVIDLQQWLKDYVANLTAQYNEPVLIDVVIKVQNPSILFDTNQLYQVFYNLCENGLFYSKLATGKAQLKIEISQEKDSEFLYVDIYDKGAGIPEKDIDYIFEPFFTTKKAGTGLGLYITRELCQANGAKIYYFNSKELGSYFRVAFNRKLVRH